MSIEDLNRKYTLYPWVPQKNHRPLSIDRAQGSYVYTENKAYLDFSSQLMNVNLGHNHPRIVDAIRKQLQVVCSINPAHSTQVRGELGQYLSELTQNTFQKTFFTNGGTDAVESAIKVARLYSKSEKIITKYRSYHGSSYGSLSAGGDPRKQGLDRDGATGFIQVEDPYCYRCPWDKTQATCHRECVDHMERIINFHGASHIAAILIEGESGTSGVIKNPPDYWIKVSNLAKKHNILLISDEVISGFGRCKDLFASTQAGGTPDIIAFAKGITGGHMPLGGILLSPALSQYFDENTFQMGLTYSAHPLSCAAALETLKILETKEIKNKIIENAQFFQETLQTWDFPILGDIRINGLLGVLELVKCRKSKRPLDLKILVNQLLDRNLLTLTRDNFVFMAPPLNIELKDLKWGLNQIKETLAQLSQDFT